jgi:hypothetical protein
LKIDLEKVLTVKIEVKPKIWKPSGDCADDLDVESFGISTTRKTNKEKLKTAKRTTYSAKL